MKVIAFDLFGTVFDLSRVDRREIIAYIDHISKPEWSPLELPESWKQMPPFADSREGIERLRTKYTVVTCSNAPLGLQIGLCKNAGIQFDGLIPLELERRFKPSAVAYATPSIVLGVPVNHVLMVTGNERLGRLNHGDVHYAGLAGIKGQLIRNPGCPQTIIELAEQLGC